MTPKWLQQLQKKRKIKEQQKLIKASQRPWGQRRYPAAKFANQIGTK